MKGQINIPVMVVLAIIVPLLSALAAYSTAKTAMCEDIRANSTRLDSQERQLDKMEDKLDRILEVLMERK